MLKRFLRKFRREDGTATVEFAILFMPFMLLLASSYEIGMANVRHVMLERGTDLTVRQIRLNTGAPPNREQVKQMVCNNAGIIPDCLNVLSVELRTVDMTSWDMPPVKAECRDRDEPITPLTKLPEYTPGLQNEMMFMRFCVVIDPMFPTFGLGANMPKDDTGGYRLVSMTAFVNEPT